MTVTDSLQQQYTETVHASFHDSLTGLFNYGFFQLLLEREIQLSQRHGNIFTFVLVDIDDFSLVNKRLGTVRGDRLLKEIGSTIKESLREVDIAARYEDDTFAIILAETGECSLRQPLERLFARVAARIDQETTISAGLVVCPDDAHNLQSIIYKAREALRQAKSQGKNRYVIAGAGEPETEKEQPTILVVDDEPLNTKLLAATLATEKFQVITVHSGEDALEILDKQPIDLVLLYIMMPGMDGYEVCRLIKDGERTRMIPVVMVTALDDVEAKVRAINAGADDFLTKPPETVELLARVRSLVRVKTLNENLTSIENVLFSFANAVESKDHYTQGHISRVAELAERSTTWERLPLMTKSLTKMALWMTRNGK
jgi:putative two-component system response regulator